MAILSCRNTHLTLVASNQSLGADFNSNIIDFKEMNTGFIQTVTTSAPDALDGSFSLKVSILPDPASFTPYPDSVRTLNASCNNFGWAFHGMPFRYAMVCYTANSVTAGLVTIYARAKLT